MSNLSAQLQNHFLFWWLAAGNITPRPAVHPAPKPLICPIKAEAVLKVFRLGWVPYCNSLNNICLLACLFFVFDSLVLWLRIITCLQIQVCSSQVITGHLELFVLHSQLEIQELKVSFNPSPMFQPLVCW